MKKLGETARLNLEGQAMPTDAYTRLLARIEFINNEIFQTEKHLKWMRADWRRAEKPRLEAAINNYSLSLERRQKAENLKALGIAYIKQMEANVSLARRVRQEMEEHYNYNTNALYGEMPKIILKS